MKAKTRKIENVSTPAVPAVAFAIGLSGLFLRAVEGTGEDVEV